MADDDSPHRARAFDQVLADVRSGTSRLVRSGSGHCDVRWSGGGTLLLMIDDGPAVREREFAAIVEAATGREVLAVRRTAIGTQRRVAFVFALGPGAAHPRPRVIGDAISAERRARETVAQSRRLVAESVNRRRENLAQRAAATSTVATRPFSPPGRPRPGGAGGRAG